MFAASMGWSYLHIAGGTPSPRQQLCTALSLLWCLRLGVFLFNRILRRGADWRFDKLITEPSYNGFAWVSQGTWVWLQGMCLWQLNQAPAVNAARPLGWLDGLGVAIWCVGFATEITADRQKTAWNEGTLSDGQRTWINSGLWAYSRHPNFFGENFLWLGMALATMGGLPEGVGGAILALISPAWSCFFLLFTSLMLLEKRMDAKFGSDPAYLEHKRTTSVLVPWWPQKRLVPKVQ